MTNQLEKASGTEKDRGTAIDALISDLHILDQRLQAAIERLNSTLGEGIDSSQRGLVIDEGDVDLWLSNLGGEATPRAGSTDAIKPGFGREGGRLATLVALFNLSPREQAILLTTLAPEFDLTYANLYAYVQDDVTKKYTTLDLINALWCSTPADKLEMRSLLAPGAPLRQNLLLSVDDSTTLSSPILTRPVILDPRITSYLLGADDLDPAIAASLRLIEPQVRPYAALNPKQMDSLARLVKSNLPANVKTLRPGAPQAAFSDPDNGLLVWMRGPEKLGKREAAEHLSHILGRPLLIVESSTLINSGSEPRKAMQRILREARLRGAVLYWANADALSPVREQTTPELPQDLAYLLSDWSGCSLFDIQSAMALHVPGGPTAVELDFPAPSNDRRRLLWEHALNGGTPLAADVDLSLLTGAFKLTGDQISAAADSARHVATWRTASSGAKEDSPITMRDLMTACRAHSNQGLGVLARKVIPVYTWADLVLPGERLAQLREMCLHIRYGPLVFEEWGFDRKLARGKGLNVLFAGPPGTGKTMAAEVLATDLGLELYKIDLSGVVSKYIGETEKNLEKIFHEGQTSNAMLFFDEADSLFGKRSEVKDSHDRYANLETSYLLQRMEEYDGIVILATNLRKNLDDAFIRRMHGAIEFPMPEEPDRLEIWHRTFPLEAPLAEDVDFTYFAKRFKLSGGNIKNIVLEAAFFAADAGTPISMVHLVRAVRREHQKIGKLIHADDFGPYAYLTKVEEPA